MAWLLLSVRAARMMKRHDVVQAGIESIAADMEIHRQKYGLYPSSIEDLMTSNSDPKWRVDLDRILHDQFNDKYIYQSLTNGFVITVLSPGSWWMNADRNEKRFAIEGVSPPANGKENRNQPGLEVMGHL